MDGLFSGARAVRATRPLIHCVTNYVTVNDCANVLLAIGASPIMSDAEEEVEEIVAISSGLNINLGTLNASTIRAMFLAGKKANELGLPVTLDPVGVGASRLRTETARRLLAEVRFAAIRGNASEINVLARGFGSTRGVDVGASDAADASDWRSYGRGLARFSREVGAVVVASGAVDALTDGSRVAGVFNGSASMSSATGCGCMLTSVLCAWIASRGASSVFEASVGATSFFGLCGEVAAERTLARGGGSSTFRAELIDAASLLTPERIAAGARVEFA